MGLAPPDIPKVVGGDSVSEFWEEHRFFSGMPTDCEYVFGGPGKQLSLRDRYDFQTMHKPVKDDLEDLRDRLEVERIKAEWQALIEAVGEEHAIEARKFYDVRAYPRNLELLPKDESALMRIEFDIVIKPKQLHITTTPQTETTVILCEACDHGMHQYHQESSKYEPCECVICGTEGEY
jgi:hypothetical protein